MRILALACVWITVLPVFAQRRGGGNNPPVASLKTISVPKATGLERYIEDEAALVALGKALFWDMQAGSDGRTACATCHFHAGADHRIHHQLSGPDAAVNQVLTSADFPFHRLANAGNNRSAVLSSKRQVAGSMGVVARSFVQVEPGNEIDRFGSIGVPSQFMPNGIHVRQVTTRNSPSVINAVYNVQNFWDGRASSVFTGATPFGVSDTGSHALAYRNGKFEREAVRIENASLASQAVGPALNSTEMSWQGRSWPQLGRKMMHLRPLARQTVSITDSVLGSMASPDGSGLLPEWSYERLIHMAFRPEYSGAPVLVDGYTLAEVNFALFWGLAIQAYEATLVANDSRVDRFLEGDTGALTTLEQQGLNEFRNGGSQCTNCHGGAELSAAGWSVVQRRGGNFTTPEDLGFFRIGVRPIADDAGLGGKDDFGNALYSQAGGNPAGTFKAPGLRNVEFTGPYFHNGGQATLEQVLEFYDRDGDFPGDGNLGRGIGNIRLGQGDRRAIVAFLKALSDDRVRFQKAPFDHPSLCVPNGHVEESGRLATDSGQTGLVAPDRWVLVPAVGMEGSSAPLQTFEELLDGVGNDGSRANTMTVACQP